MSGKRFYEDGSPQCQQRCVVLGKVCICEFLSGHTGECERVPTTRLASIRDLERWPVYSKFV
jgi:hypothetical protein